MIKMATLNWVDYGIVTIIAVSVVISFLRGFVKEAVSLVVWLLAAFVAVKFSGFFAHHLEPYISSLSLRYILVFIVLFFLILMIGIFISVFVSSFIHKSGLSFVDRLLGLVFGAGRGIHHSDYFNVYECELFYRKRKLDRFF